MSETENRTITAPTSELHTDEPAPGKMYSEIHFDARGWLLLALSLIPAGLLCFGGACINATWQMLCTPLFHLSALLLAIFAAGRRARYSPSVCILLAVDAALIILGVFHRNAFLADANRLAIPLLTALTMLTAAGVNRSSPLSADSLLETLARSLRGMLEYIPLPAASMKRFPARKLGGAILALIVCIPILVVVLLLLLTADEVFLSWFDRLFRLLPDLTQNQFIPRLLLTIAAALLLFSWSFTLTQRGRDRAPARCPSIPAIFPAVLLTMLNAIYLLFVYIQFSNLFGGTESAAMTGGYAEYARSGFFQLVAVSAINLLLLAISIHTSRGGWIRVMSLVTIAATGVILASALWRMRLYISVYGLTVLRVMTLWGMLAIAVLLVVATISLFAPRFRAFQAGMICLLALWLAVNAVNIDAIIANYNVNAYLSGGLEELDVDYLHSLSASEEALKRLPTLSR